MPQIVLGLMSGSSLDGLDFALVEITKHQNWTYKLIKAQTIKYPEKIVSYLLAMPQMKIHEYIQHDNEYTQFMCDHILKFIEGQQVDLISSHGHTIFHQPDKGITLQCGNPTMIAAVTGINTVGNFRQLDVFRGGQGAPLVPFGQQLFQSEYKNIDVYLNLGGICNIGAKGIGWDIGFCNMYSNKLAQQLNKEYDEDGSIGKSGSVKEELLQFFKSYDKINKIQHEKSFGRQHFDQFIRQVNVRYNEIQVKDKLRTYYDYLVWMIVKNIEEIIKFQSIQKEKISVLCTGGGAYNRFLIDLLNENEKIQFILPDKSIVQFKQAIIFAFLGLKSVNGIQNCSKGVGGVLAMGNKNIDQ